MDQDALDRLLESERFTLRQAVAALRWAAVEPAADDAALAEHRQRLAFLVELLHRHSQRLFSLVGQRRAVQFAVEWQESSYSPPRLDDPELLAELNAILEATRRCRAGDPRLAHVGPERLEPLLDGIEHALDEEQAAWDAGRALAVG